MISATIVGRLGADPEVGHTSNASNVTRGSIASNSKDKDGNERATWVQFSIWGKRGETFARFHRKGQIAVLSGRLEEQSYRTRDGEERTALVLNVSDWTFAGDKPTTEPATSRGAYDPDPLTDDGTPF